MAKIISYEEVDDEVERRLTREIIRAICKASLVQVPLVGDAMAIRTMETTKALITALAMVLAISPKATRSPSEMRHYADEVHRNLVKLVRASSNEECLEIFRYMAMRDEERA